ncbi:MAG: flagellin [Pseudomonadales bacterium]
MSMVIGTNVSSLTTQRHLEASRAEMETSMERLASGKRINSAMDDAAGLAIAHSLDSKISSLNQGVRNANDGISMLQTAEGALEETSSMLNRMKEIATQASSGSYSAANRTALNAEFQALATAITSIAKETDFNGTHMLNSTNSVSFQVGDGATDNVTMQFQGMKATDLSIFDTGPAVLELADQAITVALTADTIKMAATFTIATAVAAAGTSSLEMDVNGTTYTQAFETSVAATMVALAAQISADNDDISAIGTSATVLTLTSLTAGYEFASTGLKVISDSNNVVGTSIYAETQVNGASVKQAGTHTISAVTAANQTLSVEINGTTYAQDFITDATVTMAALASKVNNGTTNLTAVATSSTVLTLTSTSNGAGYTTGAMQRTSSFGGNASILTAEGATEAMSALDKSIGQVDSYRSELGAVANRLNHTVSNLMNRVENQSAAKSRIEDTDFAVESANLAKAQVLQQAGTAMLAQANASGQGVLSLLK